MSVFLRFAIIFSKILCFTTLWAVTPDSTEKIPETVYVYPTCDSLGIPLFIDGVQVGVSPLSHPVLVLAGFHEIGYAPPQIKNEVVKARLQNAIKRVYVPIGDTVKVALYFDHEYNQFKALRSEHKIAQYIGMMMTFSALYIFWQITG